MKLLALYSFLSVFAVGATTGLWVKSNGDVIEVPCPDMIKFGLETRIPAGCTAHRAGVWISATEYKEYRVQLAEASAQIQQQQMIIDALKQQLKQVEDNLVLCRAIPECVPCIDHSLKHNLTGAAAGAAITGGGCLLWTLFR